MTYSLWPDWSDKVLPLLRNQMTNGTFEYVLSNSELYKNGDENLIIKAKSEIAADWLRGRLTEVVKRSLLAVGLPDTISLQFTYDGGGLLDTPADNADEAPQPIWDTKAQALWCLNHKEAHSQYFRYYWRPLLGPLLSEIVRELRQIAYRKDSRSSEVEIKVTQITIANMIGSNNKTICDALKRPKNGTGEFYRNKYLHLFIPYSKAIKEYNEAKYRKVNAGILFRIRMTEPILQEHESFF